MRLVGVGIALLGAIALVAAACGGTSSSDKTSTAAAGGVGGAQVTPVTTSAAAGSPTAGAVGSPTAAAGSPTAEASAAATGTASGTAAAGAPVNLTLSTASGDTIAFDKTTLNAPAGAQVTVTYTNNSDLAHNVHFFNGADASAPSLGMTELATGPDTKTVTFTAPTTPGTYFYHCDAHPTQMMGELVVQ